MRSKKWARRRSSGENRNLLYAELYLERSGWEHSSKPGMCECWRKDGICIDVIPMYKRTMIDVGKVTATHWMKAAFNLRKGFKRLLRQALSEIQRMEKEMA